MPAFKTLYLARLDEFSRTLFKPERFRSQVDEIAAELGVSTGSFYHHLDNKDDLVVACFRRSFALAGENGVRSIAFPAISCGVYGYPKAAAARIAVTECLRALAQDAALEEVFLVAFDAEMTALYEAESARGGL